MHITSILKERFGITMSIQGAGTTIRNARLKSGLTLEKLSEGICTVQALNRIEKEKSGVSPTTFHALMERLGVSCSILPVFENWNDYECFTLINHTKFFIDSWQLEKAEECLRKIQDLDWNHNKLNYQEWLLTYIKLIIKSFSYDHSKLISLIQSSIALTQKDFDFSQLNDLLLSKTEIELFIAYSYENLFTNEKSDTFHICTQIACYLEHSNYNQTEKNLLLAENAICLGMYLMKVGDYMAAFTKLNNYRHLMVVTGNSSLLLELSFLTALCQYHLNQLPEGLSALKDVVISAVALKSPFAKICMDYLENVMNIHLFNQEVLELLSFPDVVHITIPEIVDTTGFFDGVYDLSDYHVISFGRLIQELRIRQNLSQQTICEGLCSKSKLSKIENGTLSPSIILAESLLQRLGVSDREFFFFGDKDETLYHELKYKLMIRFYLEETERQRLFKKFSELDLERTPLYKQFYLLHLASATKSETEKMDILWKALSYSIKDFDIFKFYQYRFTWVELTILNNIAYQYRYTDTPEKGIRLFHKILEYKEMNDIDPLFELTIYPITYHKLSRFFYSIGYHNNLIDLHCNHNLSILNHNYILAGSYYFYLCQSLFEKNIDKNNKLYVYYACALKSIIEDYTSTPLLLDELSKKFDIQFIY